MWHVQIRPSILLASNTIKVVYLVAAICGFCQLNTFFIMYHCCRLANCGLCAQTQCPIQSSTTIISNYYVQLCILMMVLKLHIMIVVSSHYFHLAVLADLKNTIKLLWEGSVFHLPKCNILSHAEVIFNQWEILLQNISGFPMMTEARIRWLQESKQWFATEFKVYIRMQ